MNSNTTKRSNLKPIEEGSVVQLLPPTAESRDTTEQNGRHFQTDIANAARLISFYGDSMRYCPPWRRWLVWDGKRWAEDQTGAALRLAKRVAEVILREAIQDGKPMRWRFAAQIANQRRLEAMLTVAMPELSILPEQLDRDPCLFNCPNGTLDLRTGELCKPRREDYITQLCPTAYRPDAPTGEWDAFLQSLFAKPSLIEFLQRLFGFCLTGDVREQLLPIFWGEGANGKSTLMETILHVLGPDYAMKAPADLLVMKKNESHPTERADLFGKRFVACVESGEGRRLNETFVKELTGADKIRARRLYENNWEFHPTHKAVLCTNHCPELTGTDHAIWRRLALVPFQVTFWDADKGETGPAPLKQDKTLPIRLKQAAEGILAWCVRGCLDWHRDGLTLPPEVVAATQRYRIDQDVVAAFIEDCCKTYDECRVRASDIYTAFMFWCLDNGRRDIGQKQFGEAIGKKFERQQSDGVWYKGIELAKKK